MVLGFLITLSPAGFRKAPEPLRGGAGAHPDSPLRYVVVMALGTGAACVAFRRATLSAPLGALVGQFLFFLIIQQPEVGWLPLIALPSYAGMAFIPAAFAVGIIWTLRPTSWPQGD